MNKRLLYSLILGLLAMLAGAIWGMDAWAQAAHNEDPSVRWSAARILNRDAPALAAQAGVK